MNELGLPIPTCEDCGRGFQCDAYPLPRGDRCLSLAVRSVALDMSGWHIVQVGLCADHLASWEKAGKPRAFVATPEQVAAARAALES